VFKRTISHNAAMGFTLLEIMLVIVLIAMSSIGVMMVIPQHINERTNVDWQAQRFSAQLQFAQDEALISGKELALVFEVDGYRFTFYDHASKEWLALPPEQLGEYVEIPAALNFEYQLLGSAWDALESQNDEPFIDEQERVEIEAEETVESFSPQVFIMSSGQVTPFSVQFTENSRADDRRSHRLEVNMSGTIIHIKSSDQ